MAARLFVRRSRLPFIAVAIQLINIWKKFAQIRRKSSEIKRKSNEFCQISAQSSSIDAAELFSIINLIMAVAFGRFY